LVWNAYKSELFQWDSQKEKLLSNFSVNHFKGNNFIKLPTVRENQRIWNYKTEVILLNMKKEILVLDIETTGLNPNEDLILELGIVKLDLESGQIIELFNQVFKDPKLTAKHRESWIFQNGFMTLEEVRDAKPLSEYKQEIQEIMDPFKGLITAWNREFDSAFLIKNGFNLGPEVPCPMKNSVDYFKIEGKFGYKWPKAQEAWDILFPETPKIEEHRGLDDSKMEAAIIHELFKRGEYSPF
jgi:hypothetical protein|tara:strand:+ start:22876 stop:23598 length:723 start_codon:yes stop_codon:yes gene_type:complete